MIELDNPTAQPTPDTIRGINPVAEPRTSTHDTMAMIREWQQQISFVADVRRANHQERHWQEGRYGETPTKNPTVRRGV